MPEILYVLIFSLIGGVVSLVGGVLLLTSRQSSKLLAEYATPFAAGALLAAVFLDLFKDGMHDTENHDVVLYAALAGILLFFFAERFLRWFHHHHQHGKEDPTANLIIIGDTLHNAMDGIAIAAAFLVSIPTGIVTTIAVAAHEIPQEIGDFGLLLSKGLSRRKVLTVNALSALATTGTALLTFQLGQSDSLPTGILLGLSGGFLLYIATSDIIPTLHEKAPSKKIIELQPILLLLGVAVVALSIQLSHRFIETEEHNDMPTTQQITQPEPAEHTHDATPSLM